MCIYITVHYSVFNHHTVGDYSSGSVLHKILDSVKLMDSRLTVVTAKLEEVSERQERMEESMKLLQTVQFTSNLILARATFAECTRSPDRVLASAWYSTRERTGQHSCECFARGCGLNTAHAQGPHAHTRRGTDTIISN